MLCTTFSKTQNSRKLCLLLRLRLDLRPLVNLALGRFTQYGSIGVSYLVDSNVNLSTYSLGLNMMNPTTKHYKNLLIGGPDFTYKGIK